MLKQSATPKQTSGGGYLFENEVVAYVLVHLLSRSSPFDPPGGLVERISVQRPASEWHLDDLLVSVKSFGSRHNLAFSVKSSPQISSVGFPDDFVRDAWTQLLRDSSTAFREEKDFLGLIATPLESNIRTKVNELLKLARDQEPSDLAFQLGIPGRTNDFVRTLHESAKCPNALAVAHGIDESTSAGRLLRRLLWIPLDLEDEGSVIRVQAINLCQRLLRSGKPDDARSLWARIKEIADGLRRSAGSIDLAGLLGKLRGQFDLLDFPDHLADWEKVDRDSRSVMLRVRSTIGGSLTLPREDCNRKLSDAFESQRSVAVLGASGTGKSAVAKAKAEAVIERGRVLWFDAERLRACTLSERSRRLDLVHELDDLIKATPARDALLVLDGLDRLYDASGYATAAELVAATRLDDPASPWRLLVTCTTEEWSRVNADMTSHGIVLDWIPPVVIDLPDDKELEAVWTSFPQLAILRFRRHLAPVLFRPKVLDLLATVSAAEDELALVGESDVAEFFWNREVARGKGATARAVVAGTLAEYFADKLVPDASASVIGDIVGAGNAGTVDELVQDKILVLADGRISFEHDLYADWVRAQKLKDVAESGKLSIFLASRLESPIWHRALRLHGIRLLESTNDLSLWQKTFEHVGSSPGLAGVLAQDILLEATAFASSRGEGLLKEGLWPLLEDGEGHYLERLLKRLLHSATIPNAVVVDAVAKIAPDLELHIAASARLPQWQYWSSILALIHSHRSEIPARVRGLVAQVAALWLRSTRPSWPLRDKAAAIAVELGDALLADKEAHGHLSYAGETGKQIYKAVLASGHEEPDRTTQICLEGGGRRAQRFAPPPLTEEEISEVEKRRPKGSFTSMSLRGPLLDPWPHGPGFRVDGALQDVVLETDALQPIAETLPDVASELLLALLINPPRHRGSIYERRTFDWHCLERPNWIPQFYTRGPFLPFLSIAEEAGVLCILRLVDHATNRWVERRSLQEMRNNEVPSGSDAAPSVEIFVDGEKRRYLGDFEVFRWSLFGPDSDQVVGSALVALEKHLYNRADAGDDLTELIRRLLTECTSLAIVGLLGVFGRRHPKYLRGILRGLLGSPDVLAWTISGSVADGWDFSLSPGFTLVPEPLRESYRQWHEMPHRRSSLRDWMQSLLVNDLELRPYFEGVRERLIADSVPGGEYDGSELVENLVAQLDPENYSIVQAEDGNHYAQYTPPEGLQRKHEEHEEAMEVHLTLLTLPVQCLKLIEGEEPLETSELDLLYKKAQMVDPLGGDGGGEDSSQADALAGVAAVLILRGGDWLTEHAEEANWAKEILLKAAHEDRYKSIDAGLNWDRLVFAAKAMPSLWAETPEDKRVREAVAYMIFHSSSETVGTVAVGVANRRKRLPEDHLRVLDSVFRRAALEEQLRRTEQHVWMREHEKEEELARRQDEGMKIRDTLESLESDLIDGTTGVVVPSLDDVAPYERADSDRSAERASRRLIPYRPIDEGLAVAAFRGIPDSGDDDEGDWGSIWITAIDQTFSPLAQPIGQPTAEPEASLRLLERYLTERAAAVVASTKNQHSAKKVWEPIISLGASAPRVVSWFICNWTRFALFPDAHQHVVSSWTAMINTALDSPRWRSNSPGTFLDHQVGTLWRELLGFAHNGADVFNNKLRDRMNNLRPQIESWARTHFTNAENVQAFARFLTMPAAADLVVSGISWLHAAATKSEYFWGRPNRSQSEEAVLSLLVHVWKNHRTALGQGTPQSTAFRGLLEMLVSRQYGPALELADRVGEFRG